MRQWLAPSPFCVKLTGVAGGLVDSREYHFRITDQPPTAAAIMPVYEDSSATSTFIG
jgi:hypothetical protein